MILDPTNRYIAMILANCDLSGKNVLEIGCGKGRITRELASHASNVVATDPDGTSLEAARTVVAASNVKFIEAPTGVPDLPASTFDTVIYTLSLHHVPLAEMSSSLCKAADLVEDRGLIVVIEPGDGGSLTEAKERFGAGSGDEHSAKEAAIRAMRTMGGWSMGETILFTTLFHFENEEDFFLSMLPDYQVKSEVFMKEVIQFLHAYKRSDGITLDAERRLNVLRRN